MRKLSKPLKALIVIVLFSGMMFLIFAETLNNGGKICAKYYNMECRYYNYFEEMCDCETGKLFLNNTMIEKRNEEIEYQNKIFESAEWNFETLNWSKYVVTNTS